MPPGFSIRAPRMVTRELARRGQNASVSIASSAPYRTCVSHRRHVLATTCAGYRLVCGLLISGQTPLRPGVLVTRHDRIPPYIGSDIHAKVALAAPCCRHRAGG